jgi:hippurate hydrolase
VGNSIDSVRAGKPGTIMAAADLFDARIIGRGGHAAKPHLNVDAVLAASAIVMALQV